MWKRENETEIESDRVIITIMMIKNRLHNLKD